MKKIIIIGLLLLISISSASAINLIDQKYYEYTHIEPETMQIPIYNGTNYISIPLYQYNPTLNAVFGDNPVNGDKVMIYNNTLASVETATYYNGWGGHVSRVEPINPTVGYKYERNGDNFILNVSGYMKYDITIFNYENHVGTNIIRPCSLRSQ